jgi:hypothetical protein
VKLTELAVNDPSAFDAFVARMRKLGVLKLGALVLGPEVKEPVERPKKERDPRAAAQRKHDVMFAATSIRPHLPEPTTPESVVPRAVVQRRARDEALGGKRQKQG